MEARHDPKPQVAGDAASALRVFCHGLHMALVLYALVGWIVPSTLWLVAHIAFIPALIVVWVANKGTCPLNNIETWATTGTWRNPDNTEEGSFLVTIVERYLQIHPTQRLMNRITYGVMAFVWALSWAHLQLLQG